MAGKKDEGPVVLEGALGEKNVWEFFVFFGILVAIVGVAVTSFFAYLRSGAILQSAWFIALSTWFKAILPYLKIISFLVCIALVYLIVIILRRLTKVNREEAAKYAPPKPEKGAAAPNASIATAGASAASGAAGETFTRSGQNKRWERVLDHIESDNQNDWKIAIIEADSILDEMVKAMGYHGDNLGERLKAIEVSDFTTLNNAWEAHKVRNMIAHEGANFQLNEREARRVIALYKTVFEEFKYI